MDGPSPATTANLAIELPVPDLLRRYRQALCLPLPQWKHQRGWRQFVGYFILFGILISVLMAFVFLGNGNSLLKASTGFLFVALFLHIGLSLNLGTFPFNLLRKILLLSVARPLMKVHIADRLDRMQSQLAWILGTTDCTTLPLRNHSEVINRLLPSLPKWKSIFHISVPPIALTLLQVIGVHDYNYQLKEPLSIIPLAVSSFLLVAPGFTMKRAVFEDLDIYRVEDACFTILDTRAPTELPLDVFARLALFVLACCPITYAILHPDAQPSEEFWKIFVPEKRYKAMALLIPLSIAAYGEITRWRDRAGPASTKSGRPRT